MKIQEIKNLYHLFRSIIANIYYGFPSKKIKVIGVTGTDGKTTTTHLIYHILKYKGIKVSMISTVHAKIGNKEFDTGFHVTTPDAWLIAKYLKKSVDNKDEYFVLETTSHRLDQNQLFCTQFKIGVITNITHEHLDYHKTYKEYVRAKLRLLKMSEIKVVNSDDESYRFISKPFISYGLKNNSDYKYNLSHEIKDIADFNKYNFLAAYTVCRILDISHNDIIKAVKSFKLPKGRLQVVYNKGFKVIIDFAHTPNAINEALRSIRKNMSNRGRLIHVFGSAGLRDNTKRPLMGKSSAQNSNLVILTEEDYRTENPLKICEQIMTGLIKKGFSFKESNLVTNSDDKICTIIINRSDAIRKAISLANKDDVIVITGKGHEKSICRGKIEHTWDEENIVKSEINSLNLAD